MVAASLDWNGLFGRDRDNTAFCWPVCGYRRCHLECGWGNAGICNFCGIVAFDRFLINEFFSAQALGYLQEDEGVLQEIALFLAGDKYQELVYEA